MTDSNRRVASAAAVNTGLLLVMAATAMPLFGVGISYIPTHRVYGWSYALGALLILAGRQLRPSVKEQPLRVKRLVRMELWTALIFITGAVFIFTVRGNDWIAFTMAGGVLTVYTAIMLTRSEKKP